ncbi:hotdog fold domain-containing protein [Nocardia rhizosphaerihabitans]|uniref:hotdog fold domain-containing protein n=1 Tax=Nocardia rhizosphaerihabitans TaxID=1691570 RepID=UPI00366EA53D
MAPDVLSLWNKSKDLPFGKKLFSAGLCFKAPYFGSISPEFDELRPGRAVVRFANSRKVHNHLGTVHAIACCNAAELAAGTMTEVSIPRSHRWIPVGMTVRYLRKATTDLRAVVEAALPPEADTGDSFEWTIPVSILDTSGNEVVHADITMHVSAKPPRTW